ncbi:MAG TPA: hypothetical protein VJ673_08140 [Aromatoleum sp.]|uniref:hypothetical protein n=1 Tax=Aromatoleum sp. TaxID=2307007 RepID=UPI002B47F102|nr:hypothetical protein [Aromatoleum sp.]HJV25643.1 hypothetical protein [Aromatoleum sp.]
MNSTRKSAFLRLLTATLAIITLPTIAYAQAIYRCEQGGRVNYTDSPCNRPLIQSGNAAPASAASVKQTVVGGGYEKPNGPWQGEAQYQVMNSGLIQGGTHFVVPLSIEISEGGKFVGSSPENNCKLLGIASPGYTPKILNLDVTLSNCAAGDLNQRYQGALVLNTAARTAQLSLHAQKIGIGMALIADVKGTMRR